MSSASAGEAFPTVAGDDLPWLSAAQMREVDRIMVDELHIDLVQMMENAGRNLARLTLDLLAPPSVCVYAGPGGNGGGGLVAARHLANAGVTVRVALAREAESMAGVPRHQLDILERMGIPVGDPPPSTPVALDCLIGYSLRGEPHGATADLIDAANAADTVIALDIPSGVDPTTGREALPCVDAAATMTLASPKLGLRASAKVGDLYLADISVPPSVYRGFGDQQMGGRLFRDGSLLRVAVQREEVPQSE